MLKLNEGDDLNCLGCPKLSDYEHLRITPLTELPSAEPVISINGATIGTAGNIITVSGAIKSGKSALISWIIAGAISEDGILADSLDGLYVSPNEEKMAVIHFDTEQSKQKQQDNISKILQRADRECCPDYFLSYNIRELELSEYQNTTLKICEAAHREHGGIKMIVIDGIADYLGSVNNEEESIAIVAFFMKLAVDFNTLIAVVVHTNPNSEKERGHLGSQCLRKSESILAVKCNNEVSHLEAKFLRNAGIGDVPQLQFAYDRDKGYHVGCGVRKPAKEDKEEALEAFVKALTELVFAPPLALTYRNAIKRIEEKSGKGETYAKNYFKEMRKLNLITQGDEDKLWRFDVSPK